MSSTRRIHVISFSPVPDEASVGGFNWYPDLAEAKNDLLLQVAEEEGAHNLALVHMDVPEGLDRDAITSYVDARLNLIEPRADKLVRQEA